MDCVTNLGCSRLEGVYIVLRFFLGLSKGGKGGTKGGYKREILSDLILSDLTNFRSISILTSDFTRPKFISGSAFQSRKKVKKSQLGQYNII